MPRLHPESLFAPRDGQQPHAHEPRNDTAMKRKKEPPAADVNALLALYNARRYGEAEYHTRALLGHYPEFGFGWKLLSRILQMQRKDALPAFQKVAELMPADAEAHYNLGVVLKSAGRLDEAVASYRKAVKLKPDFAEAHCNLGNALKELGQLDECGGQLPQGDQDQSKLCRGAQQPGHGAP